MDQSQRWSAKSAGRRSHGYCDCSLRSRSVLLGLPFLASAFFGAREAKIAGDTLRLDTQSEPANSNVRRFFLATQEKVLGKSGRRPRQIGSKVRKRRWVRNPQQDRSEEHTSELQSLAYLVCRLLLEKKKKKQQRN